MRSCRESLGIWRNEPGSREPMTGLGLLSYPCALVSFAVLLRYVLPTFRRLVPFQSFLSQHLYTSTNDTSQSSIVYRLPRPQNENTHSVNKSPATHNRTRQVAPHGRHRSRDESSPKPDSDRPNLAHTIVHITAQRQSKPLQNPVMQRLAIQHDGPASLRANVASAAQSEPDTKIQ